MPEKHFNFKQIIERIQTGVKKELPVQLANQAQNYFHRSFDNQGFDGQQWKDVKRHDPTTAEYKYPKLKGLSRRTSPILVRSGALRTAVGRCIQQATFDKVRLSVALPYASVHNEGSDKKNIPKRQFFGQTAELTRMQDEKIKFFLDRVFGE